jgi:uncharacterized SAM-binding protein YcdF (DUF218 family)
LFYISKIFWGIVQPGMLLLLLLVAAIGLSRTRFQRTAWGCVVAAALLIFVGGLLPLSTWMILPLEERFARPSLEGRPIDGIIILGGAEDSRVAAGRGVHAVNETAERLTEAAALARRFPEAKVIFTGGAIELVAMPTIGADAAGIILRDLGVDPGRLTLERNARTTYENAVLVKDIADPKPGERWLLVTSAWHMPRSIAVFRKAGFEVEAWPVDYRTAGDSDRWWTFRSPLEGLRRLEVTSREWLGLIAYRLTGRTDELLPSPR